MGIVYFLFVCFSVYFNCFIVSGAIDVDYYYASLRSAQCIGNDEIQCRTQCKEAPAICYKGECYCHHSAVESVSVNPYLVDVLNDQILSAIFSGKQLQTKKTKGLIDVLQLNPEIILNDAATRPALRHHIAHFCPNLDVARKCIRKCMEEGKPAFCGKDHTCYCGHKYTAHDKAQGLSANDTYKNFLDLYEKYFGKKPSDTDVIVEKKSSRAREAGPKGQDASG